MKNLRKFENASDKQWRDWKWQQKESLNERRNIRDFFPNIDKESERDFIEYTKHFKVNITPYTLSLLELDKDLNPKENDPIWQQVRFFPLKLLKGDYEYDGTEKNWEIPDEMENCLLQQKYPDRAIIRLSNNCLGYCSYCYLTERTLDADLSRNMAFNETDWGKSLNFLRKNQNIRDIIISGGDPLIFPNSFI